MSDLQIQYVSPDRLRAYPGNARSHSRKQLKLIEKSILQFGFTNPILVTGDFEVVAGHGRLKAAQSLGCLFRSIDRQPRRLPVAAAHDRRHDDPQVNAEDPT